nr:sperm-egg fusion protein TMEM95 isoform X1 [Macaca fascicularis]
MWGLPGLLGLCLRDQRGSLLTPFILELASKDQAPRVHQGRYRHGMGLKGSLASQPKGCVGAAPRCTTAPPARGWRCPAGPESAASQVLTPTLAPPHLAQIPEPLGSPVGPTTSKQKVACEDAESLPASSSKEYALTTSTSLGGEPASPLVPAPKTVSGP